VQTRRSHSIGRFTPKATLDGPAIQRMGHSTSRSRSSAARRRWTCKHDVLHGHVVSMDYDPTAGTAMFTNIRNQGKITQDDKLGGA